MMMQCLASKTSLSSYRDSHYKDKMVLWLAWELLCWQDGIFLLKKWMNIEKNATWLKLLSCIFLHKFKLILCDENVHLFFKMYCEWYLYNGYFNTIIMTYLYWKGCTFHRIWPDRVNTVCKLGKFLSFLILIGWISNTNHIFITEW